MKNITLDHLSLLTRVRQANDKKNRPNLSVDDPDDPRYVLGRESLTWNTLGESINGVITWDGSTEGREVMEIDPTATSGFETFAARAGDANEKSIILRYYKVSDTYLPPEQLVNMRMTVSGADQFGLPEVITVSEEGIQTLDDGSCAVGDYMPLIISAKDGFYDATEGVYILLVESDVILSLFGMTVERNIFASNIELRTLHIVPEEYLGLADVAFSGSYNDLTNLPTIRDDVVIYGTAQSLTDAQKNCARNNIGAGTSSFDGKYSSLTDTPTIPDAVTDDHINSLIDKKLGVIENGTY